jgi:hypothetical protein
MHHDTRLTTATRSSRTALVCLALIAAVLVIYTIVNVIVRPVIWSDSGWGLLWWFARHGLPFNFTYVPSRDDIAEDTPMFMAEWSPGQHVLPALLESWGLDLGQAVIVVVASFSTLGLWGWYALYRAFGFSQSTSSVTLVLVALTRHFAAPFGIYVGGEVLIFGVAPWFLLLVWRLRDLAPVAIVPLVAGTAVMFFAKLSGMIVACAAIVAAVLCTGEGPFTGRVIHRGLVAGATIALIGVIFYFAWYSRGWTAASTFGGFSWVELLSAIVFVMGSTWSAALSFGDLGNLIFVHPGRQIFSSSVPIACVFAPLAILTALFLWKQLRNRYAEYLRFCFYTAAAYGVVMVLVWSNGAPIGLEERYFRTTSMLFLVGAVQCFFDLPSRLARGLALATVALSSAYGLASQAVHVRRNLAYPMSARGFKHSTASQAVIDFLPTIDVLHPDARSTLIYVPSPEIGLDVRRVRVMAIHADVILPEHLARIVYRGRVPRLYVIVQQNLIENGKAELLLRSFADYSPDRWLKKSLGGFTCFYVVE